MNAKNSSINSKPLKILVNGCANKHEDEPFEPKQSFGGHSHFAAMLPKVGFDQTLHSTTIVLVRFELVLHFQHIARNVILHWRERRTQET
jgi:hypothetical protein